MVKDHWFFCTVCSESILDEKQVWVAICLKCEKDIKNYYFHEFCVYNIFKHLENKIKEECKDKYPIICEVCKINENIGFDSMVE